MGRRRALRVLRRAVIAGWVGLIAGEVRADDWAPYWTTTTLSQARFWGAAASTGNFALVGGGQISSTTMSNTVDIYNATSGSWTTSTLSQARSDLATAAVGSKVLFAGGYLGATSSNRVDVYDTATSTWSTASLSLARTALAGASANGKALFAGGGSGFTNVVDIYDSETNGWSTATLSVGRSAAAATALGSKIYIAGGTTLATGSTNRVDIYDTAANTWTTASLSWPRSRMSAISAGNKVLFAGGDKDGFDSGIVDILNTTTNTWSTASLSSARTMMGAASLGSKAFFAGGLAFTGGGYFSTVDIYDAATNTWSTQNLSVARSNIAATTVNNKVIFAGGYAGSSASNVIDIYTAQNYPSITSSKQFNLVDNTTVVGRTQLTSTTNTTLYLGNYNLTVGSLSGNQYISLDSGTLTVGSDGTSTTYSGALSAGRFSAALMKVGAGTLTLTGNHTLYGAIAVNAGKLVLGGRSYGDKLTVAGGASLDVTGSFSGRITLAGSPLQALRAVLDLVDGTAHTADLSNTSAAAIALTIGGASVDQPAELDFEVGATADKIQIDTARLLVNPGGAVINITALPGITEGTYDLITFPAGQASGLDRLTLGTTTLPGGYQLSLQSTATAERLVVVPEPRGVVFVLAGALAAWPRPRWRRKPA